MPPTSPNFLIICTDQMRADHMRCAGNPIIQTPHLDRLAASGVNMSRAYVNCPLCMPSRSTLFTGLTPRGHRVRTNGIPLDPTIPTMPGILASAGYQTASIGKIHLSNFSLNSEMLTQNSSLMQFPEVISFWRDGLIAQIPTPYFGLQHVEITLSHGSKVHGDYALWLQNNHPKEWQRLQSLPITPSLLGAEGCGTHPLDERFHTTAFVADRTIEYLRNHNSTQPFYLMCSFPDPHHPYHVPQPWDRKYSPEEVVPPVAREGELNDLAPFFRQIYDGDLPLSGRGKATKMSDLHRREILAHTYGMVSLIDQHIGRVLDTLEKCKLAENTVVLFISDHGDLMGDHGLLNKGPFHFEGLLRIPMIWHWPQCFPTQKTPALASLLDVAPTILDLAGIPIPECSAHIEAPMQLPAWPGKSLLPVLSGKEESVQNSVVIENDEDYLGLRLRTLVTPTHKVTTYTGHRGPEPYGELFDLANDPNELHNLWSGSGELKNELISQLHYRLTETDIALPRRLSHA